MQIYGGAATWAPLSVLFLVGNGGMDYGDYSWGLYRDYYRDPFPHILVSTRQLLVVDGRCAKVAKGA